MSKEEVRHQIDEIDDQILELLACRAKLAKETSKYKSQESGTYYDPRREREVLERLQRNNKSLLKNQDIAAIFREVMGACRNLQKPVAVAFLGPKATYSHKACLNQFGHGIEEMPCPTIEATFRSVERGGANFGVVPYENSSEGIIGRTLDLFVDTNLKIYAEIYLDIKLNLLSHQKDLRDVERVYSFKPPLDQCMNWIQANLPQAEIIQVSSTGEAAQRAAADPVGAAVASAEAASEYDIHILSKNIQDLKENVTRFLALSRSECKPSGKDKTSIVFTNQNKPGALYKSLRAFEINKINMTMIYSRPSRKDHWEYNFFVDFSGHHLEERVKDALNELKAHANWVKVLGSYPEAMKETLPDVEEPPE